MMTTTATIGAMMLKRALAVYREFRPDGAKVTEVTTLLREIEAGSVPDGKFNALYLQERHEDWVRATDSAAYDSLDASVTSLMLAVISPYPSQEKILDRAAAVHGYAAAVSATGYTYMYPSTGTDEFCKLFADARDAVYDTVLVKQAAEIAAVSVQAIRDVLRDDERRAAIFPGAYRTSDHPQRGEWRIPRAEVEAYKPRRIKPE